MKAQGLWLTTLLAFLPNSVAGQSPVTFDKKDDRLVVRIHNKPFATYVWNDRDIPRPYFAHLHAPHGAQVTRTHPPEQGKDATDHATMHPGLWLAFGDLGGADFWRHKGTVQHLGFVDLPRTHPDGGSFAVKNRYLAGDKALCEEVCSIQIRVRPDGFLLDWTSEFSCSHDFALGDQEEMGLGVRLATPLTVKKGGQITNAHGSKNEKQVWGKTADWCDYSGPIEGQAAGITLMPDPKNFRPSWFHARDYGLLVANPFGQRAFTKGDKSQVVVRPGQPLRLRFGILVHSGIADPARSYQEWLAERPWIEIAKDQQGFLLQPAQRPFVPWGFNYDHDEKGRLIEDYWEAEWAKIETDFAQMKALGANVVRIHLQVGKFLEGPDKVNEKALDRLAKLVRLAETVGLALNLTGLGCYHKKDVPSWYDSCTEKQRWDVQARFWEAIAGCCANSPAIFCYDLMNEPVVPGGRRKDGDWLGPDFAGKHFVQFITLDQKDRPRPEIARQWIEHLVAAIRKVDPRHLITVGLVDWSLDRKGLTSGFVPDKVAGKLDFVSVHIYPETGKFDAALSTLKGFAIGKPIVVEETFPLRCSPQQLDAFVQLSEKHAAGWLSFYWGKPPEELRKSKQIGDAILLQWLEAFQKRARILNPPAPRR